MILCPVPLKSLGFGRELGRKDIPSFETIVSMQLFGPNCLPVSADIPDKRAALMGLVFGLSHSDAVRKRCPDSNLYCSAKVQEKMPSHMKAAPWCYELMGGQMEISSWCEV